MRKIPVLAISLFLSALLLVSCGGGDSTAPTSSRGSGSIAFRLGSANLQAVGPIVSARVEVLNPDTLQEVLPARSLVLGEEVFFSPVPVGFQLVRATGFNADGDLSATDEEVVEVRQGETSRATLVLTPPLPDPEPEPTPTTPPTTPERLVFIDSNDGAGGGHLIAVDANTYQPVATTANLSISPEEMAVDQVGERVFLVAQNSGSVLVFNGRDLAPLPTLPIGGDQPYGVAYDSDRERVYVGDLAGTLFAIDIAPPNASDSIGVSSAHEVIYFEDRVYVAGFDLTTSQLTVLDADSLSDIAGSPFPLTTSGIHFAKHLALDTVNRRIYVGIPTNDPSSNSLLGIYDIDGVSTPTTLPVGNIGAEATGVDYDPAQNRILLSFNDGTVEIYDAGVLSTPIQITSTGPLYDVLVDNTENRILNTRSNAPLLESLDNTTNLPIPGSPFTIAPTGNTLRNIEIGDF